MAAAFAAAVVGAAATTAADDDNRTLGAQTALLYVHENLPRADLSISLFLCVMAHDNLQDSLMLCQLARASQLVSQSATCWLLQSRRLRRLRNNLLCRCCWHLNTDSSSSSSSSQFAAQF